MYTFQHLLFALGRFVAPVHLKGQSPTHSRRFINAHEEPVMLFTEITQEGAPSDLEAAPLHRQT